MPQRTSKSGSELFIVDNSDADWKVLRYLHDWCQISSAIDIATGYFEIGSLLSLQDEWQKVDAIRILMGDEVSKRTRTAFAEGLARIRDRLDASLEKEKDKNDFLAGVPAIVDAIRSGKISCRVYRREKFHAKAYLTHARLEVVGSSALVGSSNFTYPGLTENIELNVQITGRPVGVLQEWYEEHWNKAEDVTPEILTVIERHTQDYSPFEVYAKALHEYCRQEEISDTRWLEERSRIYPILDRYQREGFHKLIAIADEHRGAFLCDGVGLGKTFIGLMLIEYLIERLRKRVVLLVPKAGREPVWEQALHQYLPHLADGDFSNLAVFNHTDLQRAGNFPARLKRIKEMADAVVIDEAHHFRNPGVGGEGDGRGIQAEAPRAPSRYRRLYDLLDGPTGCKQVFLLTATPVNNRLIDLQHMIELFSRRVPDYFKSKVGIHSLPGHFRKMEKDLLQATNGKGADTVQTDLFEAEQVLAGDALFQALVVQRSRAYVRESQLQQGGSIAVFPTRESPHVADYNLKKTYGRLLDKVEQAFAKEKPLFSLAIYYPLAHYRGDDQRIDKFAENRQEQVVGLIRTQFLKRFESSAHAFACSCDRLLAKLLAFATKHSDSPAEQRRLERWKIRHKDLIGYVHERQLELFGSEDDDEADEDLVSEEMLEAVGKLSEEEYDVATMLNETYNDLDQIIEFLHELRRFEAKHDDKLKALAKLLKTDAVLSKHKVLIFTEFADTARYLKEQLTALGVDGIDQIDSDTKRDRGDVIRAFAPYYNGTSSPRLEAAGKTETRVLISTDVLSEGLNLQDATRLINYDIHWNPVRLMQRIGRVDRRLNPAFEEKLLDDHPDQKPLRGSVAYWNFLPPDELNDLLRLYQRVAHKTLRISRTFGIEGQKLLTPEDDYEALRNFNHAYEGTPTPVEDMHLEYQRLLREFPDLAQRLDALPGRVFSGKAHPAPGTRAVFFCYTLPAVIRGATLDEPLRQGSLFNAPPPEAAPQQGLLSGAAKKKLAARINAEEAKLRESLHEQLVPGSVDWRVAFAEVFKNGGFDIALENPPYVRMELFKDAKPTLRRNFPQVYDATADLYVYFYARTHQILRPGGTACVISSNKWLKAGYGESLRRFFAECAWVEAVVDFGHAKQIFQEADVFPSILVVRKPTTGAVGPTAHVCAIPRERLRLDDLSRQVETDGFAVPRDRLGAAPWTLEPPGVAALLEKIRRAGVPLREFARAEPLSGIKTGFNNAFLVDTPTKDRLVSADPKSATVFKPYLRGQDVNRWHPEWAELWMLAIKSSGNYPWPWARAGRKAEGVFAATYPAIHAHLNQYRDALTKRQDQGEHWWELRACAYWDAFNQPKIIYPEITWRAEWCFDDRSLHINNTVYILPVADYWILSVANSPLMWWLAWRTAVHGKDEALRFIREFVQEIPICSPTDDQRNVACEVASRLICMVTEQQAGRRAVLDWLRGKFGVEKPSQKLQDVATLDADTLAAEVQKARGKKQPLSVAQVKALKQEHARSVAPLQALAAEARQLERRVADLVNAAYGLTPEEVALMWRTAPPRMPGERPNM